MLAIVLAGCSAAPPIETAPPSTTRAPAFASMDEAFEAAVAVYRRYVELSDQIGADGGERPERILEVATDEFARADIETYATLKDRGLKAVGASTFRNPQLVQYQDESRLIQIYACADVSALRLVDQSGVDVTPERENEVPLVVSFEILPDDVVLVSKSDVWDGERVC